MTLDPTLTAAWMLTLPALWAAAAPWAARRQRRAMAAIEMHSADRGDKQCRDCGAERKAYRLTSGRIPPQPRMAGGDAVTITLILPVADPALLLSINEQNRRGHWARKKCADHWKPLTVAAARKAQLPPIGPAARAHITVAFRFPNDRIRDTGNLYPVAKACVDGLVTYGLLPGDDDRYLDGPDLRRLRPNGPHEVHITIKEALA